MNLIREKERDPSHRDLNDRFHISLSAVTKILNTDARFEYIKDYARNQNKKAKRKKRRCQSTNQ